MAWRHKCTLTKRDQTSVAIWASVIDESHVGRCRDGQSVTIYNQSRLVAFNFIDCLIPLTILHLLPMSHPDKHKTVYKRCQNGWKRFLTFNKRLYMVLCLSGRHANGHWYQRDNADDTQTVTDTMHDNAKDMEAFTVANVTKTFTPKTFTESQ